MQHRTIEIYQIKKKSTHTHRLQHRKKKKKNDGQIKKTAKRVTDSTHKIGSCCNLYFVKCVFLTKENYSFVHSTEPKKSFIYKRFCQQSKIGMYRDNLSIIIIAQNGFDLSITAIVFVMYFVIAINDSLCLQCSNFKVSELALWNKYTCPLSLITILFVLFNATAESVNCFLSLKNLLKLFCNLTFKKKFCQTH